MADKMTPQQRHKCMSHIRSKNTRPEMLVRRFLWHNGYRYRLHAKQPPGHPDIVIRRLRTAIFVNGCFWHGHSCRNYLPASNRKFWFDKISRNRERDLRDHNLLEADGWMVIVIWECQLSKSLADDTLQRLLNTLNLLSSSTTKPVSTYPTEEDYNLNYDIAAETETTYTASPSPDEKQ